MNSKVHTEPDLPFSPPPPHDNLWLSLLTQPNFIQVLRCACLLSPADTCHCSSVCLDLTSLTTFISHGRSLSSTPPRPSSSCPPPTWYSLTTHKLCVEIELIQGQEHASFSCTLSEHLRQRSTQQMVGIC